METDTTVYLHSGTRLSATEEGSADVHGSSNGPSGDAEGQKADKKTTCSTTPFTEYSGRCKLIFSNRRRSVVSQEWLARLGEGGEEGFQRGEGKLLG